MFIFVMGEIYSKSTERDRSRGWWIHRLQRTEQEWLDWWNTRHTNNFKELRMNEFIDDDRPGKFEKLLGNAVVRFSYLKQNGEQREATGTLYPPRLPALIEDDEQKAARLRKAAEYRVANPTMVTYWDLQAAAFRKVNLDNLVGEPVVIESFAVKVEGDVESS